MLLILGLLLIILHFGTPLVYFGYVKRIVHRPWNLHLDSSYQPILSVIVPTYNEEKLIVRKLNDLRGQAYPRNLLNVTVLDDASQDKTRELASEWIRANPDVHVALVPHATHGGKMPMVLDLLANLDPTNEVVILTDVDAFCEKKDALPNIVRYFSDPTVAAVSCSIQYETGGDPRNENVYRDFYNQIRVGESKIRSTPNHNGQFQALRLSALREIGLPDYSGIDDSAIGSFFAFAGLRAIQADDVKVWEPSRGNVLRRKMRRANRLMMNFSHTKKSAIRRGLYKKTGFENIWRIEYWLHLINPWLLAAGTLLTIIALITGEAIKFTLLSLGTGVALLILPPYRVWVMQQFYLILARIRGLTTQDVTWKR
jgi:cellulose synthase/poly-beta-1,6-N-acetylglucosamine synthase-like glycosyltransferase